MPESSNMPASAAASDVLATITVDLVPTGVLIRATRGGRFNASCVKVIDARGVFEVAKLLDELRAELLAQSSDAGS